MYNPDAENAYGQESQPYEPTFTEYSQPHATYPQYPAYQSYQQPDQSYQSRPLTAENSHLTQGEKIAVRPQVQAPRYKEGKVARTTKAQALAIVQTCKKWLVIGSILCFGVFSGLALTHVTGVTAQSATNNSTQQAAPTTPDQGRFFQQQQGGYNFGNNGTSQGPVSSSSVS